jgi:5'-nucleotidase
MAANTTGLAMAPLASTLVREATRLRREGATIVIATAHAGGRCDARDDPHDLSSCRADEEIFEVARALPPGLVDGIVAGHRHQMVAHDVSGIPVIESYSSGRAFGRIDFMVDRGTGTVRDHRIFPPQEIGRSQYEGRPVVPTAAIEDILAPGVDRARVVKMRLLNAEIAEPLARAANAESHVGNLAADWMRAAVPQADIAITNSGGLRANLPSGRLTYGRLYELIPFDNREIIATLTGEELRRVVQHNLQQRDSMLVVSGIRAEGRCEHGGLTVEIRRPSGALVTAAESLVVVTSDFLATGGDDFFTPIMPLRTIGTDGPIMREHIAQWLTETGGRWAAADVLTPATRRIVYPGDRPVTCGGQGAGPPTLVPRP